MKNFIEINGALININYIVRVIPDEDCRIDNAIIYLNINRNISSGYRTGLAVSQVKALIEEAQNSKKKRK